MEKIVVHHTSSNILEARLRGVNMNDKPYVGITMGDPCGIGPEVVLKALQEPEVYEWCNPVVIGNTNSLINTVKILKSEIVINQVDDPRQVVPSKDQVNVIDIGNLNYEDVTVGQINPTWGTVHMEWVMIRGKFAR